MDKVNFVTGFQPDKAEFDLLQNSLESGLRDVAGTVAGMGIKTGFEVTISGSEASISPGLGLDGLGRLLKKDETLIEDLGGITRPASGKYRWVTLALRFKVTEYGQVRDINNVPNPAQYLDDVEIQIIDTEEDDLAANISKPSFSEYQVPLLDIRIDTTSPWENLITDESRRLLLVTISAHKNNTSNPHSVTKAQVELGNTPNWTGDTNTGLGTSDVKIPSQKAVKTYVDNHKNNTSNPHSVTKAQVGLGNTPNWSGDTNTALGTSNTKIPSQKAVKTYVDGVKNQLFPVGSTYIQFPGDTSPTTLGLPGTWSNVSSELAGNFIRFEGGSALAFNSGEQPLNTQDLYARISHDGGSSKLYYKEISTGAWDSTHYGTLAGRTSSAVSRTTGIQIWATGAGETRPVNRTVRKWRRVA